MLDERKRRILRAIVDDYISSAEPVASRTVARKHSLGVSSATIRNEMADLEFLGYLEHLHTSSGRIPSSKGYRFYVDDLLPPAAMSAAEKMAIGRWYQARVKRAEGVFQETAKLISRVTQNIALVLAPQVAKARFRQLQFVPLNSHEAIAVLLTDAGFMENRVVEMPDGAEFADFERMARVINHCLDGESLASISAGTWRRIREEMMDESLFEAAMALIHTALDEGPRERLYMGGATEILAQPEFHDVSRVRAILSLLEEDTFVQEVLEGRPQGGISVTIGGENTYSGIQDCSVVMASYHLDGEPVGTIAVLGPTRMEYGKAMALIGYLHTELQEIARHLGWQGQVIR